MHAVSWTSREWTNGIVWSCHANFSVVGIATGVGGERKREKEKHRREGSEVYYMHLVW